MKLIFTRWILVLTVFALYANESKAQITAQFTANVTSGCSPVLINFTDASTGNPTSWNWDFGDGNSSTQQNPSHNYATPGTYTVSLTASSGAASDVETKTSYITVFRGPTASFTVTPDSICSGGTVTFASTSTPGDASITQYTWSFNDGSQSQTTTTPGTTHVYVNLGSNIDDISPNLTVIDGNGCNSTVNADVHVLPIAHADFGIASLSGCTVPVTVTFQNNSTNTNIYSWNFGDASSGANNTSTLANPSHTFNANGSYLVTLVAGVGSCSSTDTMTLNIQPPVASFTMVDSTVCLGTSVFFTNTTTPSGAPVVWTFGDGGTSTAQTPNHIYANPGTYTVTMTASAGSCTSSATHTVTVYPNPTASFFATNSTSACQVPYTVTFSDTVSNITSWAWNFGDPGSAGNNTSTLQNPSHTYNSFGIYNVSLIVQDANGCTDSITRQQYIQLIEPIINFTRPDSGCVGSTFTFNASVISPADPNITSYDWDFGDGTGTVSVNTPTTTHQFNSVGIFDVTLTIHTATGCTETLTQAAFIKIGTQPNANFSATPLQICFQENVQFTDLSNPAPITGWLWSFGDGGGSTEQNPNHQYNLDTSGTADPFDVQLIAFYNGCPDTMRQQDLITVLSPLPFFSIAYDCSTPFDVALTNLSGGATSYLWDFGDGSSTSTATSPSHTYANTGGYNITLTATSTTTGCVVDTILPVVITNPSAVMNLDTTIACHTAIINAIGSGSQDVASLVWTFGEGIAGVRDTSHTADTLHIYNRPGYYLVTLTVTDVHGCVKVDTQTVHIIGPTAGFSASPLTGCTPVNVNFNDTSLTEGSAITSWIWNYGTGSGDTTSAVGDVSHSYSTPGNYNITLTVVDANGCSNSYTAPNYVHPSRPTASISTADTTGCRNTPQQIFGSAGAGASTPITYDWTYGDGGTGSTTNGQTTHTYSQNGLYPVHLVVTDGNGCVDSTDQNIFIWTTPAAFTTTITDSCVTGSNGVKQAIIVANFHVDSSQYASTYNWDVTVYQTINTSPDFNFTYNVPPGTYPASVTVTNQFGCTDFAYDSDAVVISRPVGTFAFTPSTGCRPLSVAFTGTATGASTYAWDFGDGTVIDNTSQININHIYTSVGTFTPQLYLGFQLSNSFCYIPADSVGDVTVTSIVTADIDSSFLTCMKDGDSTLVSVQITDPGSNAPYSYTWYPSGIAVNGPTPGTFYLSANGQSGYYSVEVGYGLIGCSAADSVYVDYCPCEDKMDTIPNVFTPAYADGSSGDGKNDFFYVKDICPYQNFRIIIFNRWGKKMYESNDPDFRWNGMTDDGVEASEGTYYYIMNVKSGELHGWIELIRRKKE